MLERFRSLYEDDTAAAHKFRYGLLAFDLATIAFVIVTSFFPRNRFVESVDLVLGAVILADFVLRVLIEKQKGMFFLRLATWADIAAILAVSVAAPLAGNLLIAALVGQARGLLRSPSALRRLNLTAGSLLIAVGAAIGLVTF